MLMHVYMHMRNPGLTGPDYNSQPTPLPPLRRPYADRLMDGV